MDTTVTTFGVPSIIESARNFLSTLVERNKTAPNFPDDFSSIHAMSQASNLNKPKKHFWSVYGGCTLPF